MNLPDCTILLDGDRYVVAWASTETRVIINYQGLYVLADWVGGNITGPHSLWELSGRPADARERVELERLTARMKDVSVVTVLEEP